MGLSSFNRMRRSLLKSSEAETERFIENNKARWEAHHARAKVMGNTPPEKLEELQKLDEEAVQEIGRKNIEGMKMGEEGKLPDLPLRADHAAEIAGRTPKTSHEEAISPMERLHERIPEGTANEKLSWEFKGVDEDGPDPELIKAAQVETAAPEDKEAVAKEFDARIAAGKAKYDTAQENKEKRQAAEAKKAQEATSGPAPVQGKVTPAQAQLKEEVKQREADEKLPAAGPAPNVGNPTSSAAKPVTPTKK